MFDNTFYEVVNAVESWYPEREYKRETGYRDDLVRFLREELNKSSPFGFGPSEKYHIQKESGRSLADIGINGKVGIELKYNLNTKAKVDMLYGQIEDYLRSYEGVIILLCGKTDEDKIDYLESKISSIPGKGLFDSGSDIKIIIKSGGRRRKKKSIFEL